MLNKSIILHIQKKFKCIVLRFIYVHYKSPMEKTLPPTMIIKWISGFWAYFCITDPISEIENIFNSIRITLLNLHIFLKQLYLLTLRAKLSNYPASYNRRNVSSWDKRNGKKLVKITSFLHFKFHQVCVIEKSLTGNHSKSS